MKNLLKRTIRAMYWEFAYEGDEYLERLAIAYARPDQGDDVIIAELEQGLSKSSNRIARVHRVRMGK